jgi:hypothetical protein
MCTDKQLCTEQQQFKEQKLCTEQEQLFQYMSLLQSWHHSADEIRIV